MDSKKFDIIVMSLSDFEKTSKFNDKYKIDDGIQLFKWPSRYGGTFEFRYVLVIEISSKKVVGISELQVNPYDEKFVWLKFIEVAPSYRHTGISKAIIQQVVSLMTSGFGDHRTLVVSDYNKIGEICLYNNLSMSLIDAKIDWKMA